MKKLSGRVAAITGGGSGIGRALAIELGRRGCKVAIADVNQDGLAQTRDLVAAAGSVCSTHVVDVADRAAVEAFAAEVVRVHGGVNIVINNAGVTLIEKAENISFEDFEWIMNINFWGVVHGTSSFLPYLRQAGEAHIVNISSLFGIMAMPLQSAYNASKFAVRGYTEALKMEMVGSTIGVSCVHPGGIKTNITRNSRIGDDALEVSKEELHSDFEKAAMTTPEKAAAAIIRGIEKNKRRILVGLDARILDWVARHFPGSYERLLRLEKTVLERVRQGAGSVR
jgi:NAD(P)-dependent dehydrogenase (short-subunit alcohol dehydrogenase family)